MRYFIDPLSFLFHPELDERNEYKTVVYNWEEQNVLKVNRFGYEILKVLSEKPGISLDELSELISQRYKIPSWQVKSKIVKFIEQMVIENVIKEEN